MDHETHMYIDGKWCGAKAGGRLAIINPATEEPCAEVAYGGGGDAERAVAAAARSLPGWSGRTAYERAEILKRTTSPAS
jgi:acyl-CoA reductase-like NAD-dependent aldehyde dehydrogenase